jgi:uncharacterized protein
MELAFLLHMGLLETEYLPLIGMMVVFFASATLYSAVGHGGASAYLMIMALCGMSAEMMKPIALFLNIVVSAVALIYFLRAGYFQSKLFWPLVISSVPAAFLGGALQATDVIFKVILFIALLVGAIRLLVPQRQDRACEEKVNVMLLLALGAGIGFISGLVGIGGGVFLTPLLVIFRWAPAKNAASLSAAFIAANSCAGIGGFFFQGGSLPVMIWSLLPCVLFGAWLGSRWGSGNAAPNALRQALAVVLLIAATKFLIV